MKYRKVIARCKIVIVVVIYMIKIKRQALIHQIVTQMLLCEV